MSALAFGLVCFTWGLYIGHQHISHNMPAPAPSPRPRPRPLPPPRPPVYMEAEVTYPIAPTTNRALMGASEHI